MEHRHGLHHAGLVSACSISQALWFTSWLGRLAGSKIVQKPLKLKPCIQAAVSLGSLFSPSLSVLVLMTDAAFQHGAARCMRACSRGTKRRGSTCALSLLTKHEASNKKEIQIMNGNSTNRIKLRPQPSSFCIKSEEVSKQQSHLRRNSWVSIWHTTTSAVLEGSSSHPFLLILETKILAAGFVGIVLLCCRYTALIYGHKLE